jgi:hypothetical protein
MKIVDYVLVDRATGEVEVAGSCPECDVEAQSPADHQVLVMGRGSRATHYHGPEGLMEYTPDQRNAKQWPLPHCRWDNAHMRWVDVRPLPELRAARWAVVKHARQATIDSPIVTRSGVFDADPGSRAALASAAAFGQVVTWTTADNDAVKLTPGELMELLQACERRTQSCHEVARALRARIESVTTEKELDAIRWPEGLG